MTFTFREIGADNFVLSNKPESMAVAAKSLDLILNTVSADHDLAALIGHDILSYITGGAPDLQCKFENHWRPGLSRPGCPIVQFTEDLEP